MPSTVTVSEVSSPRSTVPLKIRVVSLVTKSPSIPESLEMLSNVTVWPLLFSSMVVSISTVPLALPTLFSSSVAVTETLKLPSDNAAITSSASVHVPSPLLVAV